MWRITIIEQNLIEIHHKVTHLLWSQLIFKMWVDDWRPSSHCWRVNTIFNYCNDSASCRWDTHHLAWPLTLGHIPGHHPEWLTSADIPTWVPDNLSLPRAARHPGIILMTGTTSSLERERGAAMMVITSPSCIRKSSFIKIMQPGNLVKLRCLESPDG